MAKIIVLEDDPNLGPLIVSSLEDAGHAATLFATSNSAITAYETDPSDVLVADIIIKEFDRPAASGGLLTIHRMNAAAEALGRRLFVIGMSGMTRYPGLQDLLTAAQAIGADVVLRKPFRPDELLELIDSRPV